MTASDCVERQLQATVGLLHAGGLEMEQKGPCARLLLPSCSARGGFCAHGFKTVPPPPSFSAALRQRGREGLMAKTACQLPPAPLIRKTVISQQVPPGGYPLPAHQPERRHMATPDCKGAEQSSVAAGAKSGSDEERTGFGVGC